MESHAVPARFHPAAAILTDSIRVYIPVRWNLTDRNDEIESRRNVGICGNPSDPRRPRVHNTAPSIRKIPPRIRNISRNVDITPFSARP
ncbi:MAG: hypothetical protein LBP64_02050, partial [Tannerella sp.]|nr:hypothetical protein [Tannerella sp.]